MLTPKPWRLEALVRLLIGVIICVFMGSVLIGLVEFEPQTAGLRTAAYYGLSAGALVCGAIALAVVVRFGPIAPASLRFGLLLISFFMSLNLGAFAQVASGTLPRADSIWSIVAGTVSFQGATLALIWWFVREHNLTFGDAFGLRLKNIPRAVLLGFAAAGAAFALQLVYVHLLEGYRIELSEQHLVEVMRLKRTLGERIYLGVFAIVIAPVAEEMLFRGILYTAIKQLGFRRIALWGTAIVFALIHMNIGTFLPLMLLAVGLALLYEKTNTLFAPIVAHGCFNAINFAMLHVLQSSAPAG